MAGKNIYNNNDSMDINELAALDGEVSDEMLEQLTAQLTNNISTAETDGNLFEEPIPSPEVNVQQQEEEIKEEEIKESVEQPVQQEPLPAPEKPAPKKEEAKLDESFDDNFIKKYKAKLNKQASQTNNKATEDTESQSSTDVGESIEKISQGNITEKTISKEQIEYNDSLDFLDGNVKYSKYVIYVDPQNVDFIESLTVKERKNLINGILKQQGDIALTKRRFKLIETVIRHAIIAILTITVSIPIIYYAINSSLEATINNHRQSQTIWQQLYRENGKISVPKN